MAASDSVSWHRSYGDLGGVPNPFEFDETASDAVPPPLTPASLQTVQSVELGEQPPEERSDGTVRWLCYRCSSSKFDWSYDADRWVCRTCGGIEFHKSGQPLKTETADGVWLFVPHGASSPELSPDQMARPQTKKGPDASPHGSTAGSERPESESRTEDPSVDPETLKPNRRRRRGRRSAASAGTGAKDEGPTNRVMNEPNQEDHQQLVAALRDAMKQRSNSSELGQKKFRGGTPPAPPPWKNSTDLRAFARWERKVEIWYLQIQSYMTTSEAALSLFVSLTGEAELEVEHLDIKKVNDPNGVSYILNSLREPLQQRTLFQKRKLLADYENVGRHGGETVRQYVNRYKRIEKDLESVGIQSAAMYDAESRGNRLLERCKLAPDLQRLVLIAAGNSLEFDRIREALCMQFPDFRPSPAVVHGNSFGGNTGSYNNQNRSQSNHGRFTQGKGYGNSSSSSSTSASSHGKGRSNFSAPRKVFQAEQGQDLDPIDETRGEDDDHNEQDEFQDAQDQPDEEDPQAEQGDDADDPDDEFSGLSPEDLQDLASVLTVTSKKLQSTVLGRKYSGKPKTIEERKKTSTCSACGEQGHWHGDSICPMSGTGSKGQSGRGGKGSNGKSSGSGKGGKAGRDSSTFNQYPKKAFVVNSQTQQDDQVEHDGPTSTTTPMTFFTFTSHLVSDPIFEVHATEIQEFVGYMVLDTACQRSCCSEDWIDRHAQTLANFRLSIKMVNATDVFQFGSGKPQTSQQRAYFPVSFEGQKQQGVLLGVSVLTAGIPFLASNTLLGRLGCVLDMPKGIVYFSTIDVALPLRFHMGHIVVNIASFPKDVSRHAVWEKLSEESSWRDPDPELVICPEALCSSTRNSNRVSSRSHAASSSATSASRMASKLEGADNPFDDGDVPDVQVNVSTCASEDVSKGLADIGNASRRGLPTGNSDDPSGSEGKPKDLLTSEVPPFRQSSRQFQRVSSLPDEVQVQQGARRLGRAWPKQLAAVLLCAATFIRNNFASISDSSIAEQEQGITEEDSWSNQNRELQDAFNSFFSDAGGRTGGESTPDVGGSDSTTWPWLHPGGAGRDPHGLHTSTGFGCKLGWISGSSRLPTAGVSSAPLPSSMIDDSWEVRNGLCIRHHRRSRRTLFDPHDHECPVALHRLSVICSAEIEFEDGSQTKLEYNWHHPSQMVSMSRPWTGRTIFKMKKDDVGHRPCLMNNKCGRRLRTQLRQAMMLRKIEYELLQRPQKLSCRKRCVDLLETFAGVGKLSKWAGQYGLKSLLPVDYNTGFDLKKNEDSKKVDEMLEKHEPLFLLQGIDCRDWCLLQDNVNYIHRLIQLQVRRAKARPLVRRAAGWCVQQHEAHRFWLIENPVTSRLWKEPSIAKLAQLDGVEEAICHSGAYGAVNSKGEMIRKTFKFLGSCPHVMAQLRRRLSAEELKLCVPLEGKEVTQSQQYPDEMVRCILRGIRKTAQLRDPERFNRLRAFAVEVNRDPDQWSQVFEWVEEVFQRTANRTFLVPHSDRIWKAVAKLVPWPKLERIQLAAQPTLLRFPTHIPHTHRGWALLYNDSTYSVGSEDLAQVLHPRGRFHKPVNLAVFFFGYAETEEDDNLPEAPAEVQEEVEDDPRRRVVQTGQSGIHFPDRLRLPDVVKTAVSRLHRNLSHPPATELKKMLAMNGIKDQNILSAVDNLQCDVCDRNKPLPKPPPAGVKDNVYQQFADEVQMDIVYVKDITGNAFPVLGIICQCTHLHVASRLDSRNPEEVIKKFNQIWNNSFGMPLVLRTDADGAFRSHFEDYLNNNGVFVDYIPAEAHHRLGLIERHNATLRSILERVIDAQAVSGPEQLDLAITAACFAKNSGTWSSGRPPYIAAFGRIPRHGLNLLSDQHGLVFGGSREHQQQLADVLRAEAQQQMASMAVDSSFRRALLKKTQDQAARLCPDQAPIGSIVAYWRWTARSGKKRGGYRLARLLGKDPDGKSYWLQSGTNTIKVAQHQLRLAYGFEQWEPDQHDLRLLKDASDNVHRGDLLDEETRAPTRRHDDPHQAQGEDGLDDDLREFFEDTQPLPVVIPVSGSAAQPSPAQQDADAQTDPYLPTTTIIQNQQTQQQQQNTNQYQLNMHSPTYQQTNIQATGFGFPTPTTPMRTPMRRARSRTPTRQAVAPDTPPLPLPITTTSAPNSTIPPASVPDQPSSSRQPDLQLPPQPTSSGAIDLTNDDEATPTLEDAGNIVPRTPPGLERQTTPIGSMRLTPSKRSLAESEAVEPERSKAALFTCMDAEIRLQKHDERTCFFQNYGCRSPDDKMSVWARLDVQNSVLKTTHVSGPRKSTIRRRRVIDAFTGQILQDEEYDPQHDEISFTSTPCSTITELWFEPHKNFNYGTLICENDEIKHIEN